MPARRLSAGRLRGVGRGAGGAQFSATAGVGFGRMHADRPLQRRRGALDARPVWTPRPVA